MQNNPNVYWHVNGVRFSNKSDALAYASANNTQPEFYYYNNTFERYNWLVEPEQTFDEIAAERALQLRELHPYIRLWYSGGADSHTMLRAFLDNGIHIDEIAMTRSSPVDDFDNDRQHLEANLRSIPFIKSIMRSIPRTKISLLDMGADKYKQFYRDSEWANKGLMFEFTEDPGILLGTQEGMERYGGLTIHPGGVELYGGDKPKIIRKDGLFYAPIVDSTFYTTYIDNSKEFFITPEMPKLHAKQSHVMKQVINKYWPTGDVTHDVYNPKSIDPAFKRDWYYCCRQILDYDMDFGKSWDWVSPKTTGKILNAQRHNPELFKMFRGSLEEFRQTFSNLWDNSDVGNVTGAISGLYCLGK